MDVTVKALREVPDLAGVPEDQLEWLIKNGELREYRTGDVIFRKGDPIDHLLVVLEGGFTLKAEQNNQYRIVGEVTKGEVTGLLPYSRAKEAGGFSEATSDSSVLTLARDRFREMINKHEELTTALVHVMSSRIRTFTKRQQQNEKMASLGKLSAGLAHELNNPSAAVVRSARELKRQLGLVPGKFKRVIRIRAEDEVVDRVNDLIFQKIQAADQESLSMMERSNLEDDILDWLEEQNIDNDELAESLSEFSFSREDLDQLKSWLRAEDLEPVLNWVGQNLVTEKLVAEIEESSRRINDLVTSVKGYTHMDRAPEKQATDIREGIRNTLTMLNHKVKKSGIKVVEEFDPDLPHPRVYVSEINQVWTNLIDNAIDAMENSNSCILTLRSYRKGDFVFIDVQDSGKGINEEDLDTIFDPFFTTKEIGKGTGLGLDVVQQILRQHNGQVSVKSKPGETVFTISLPIK